MPATLVGNGGPRKLWGSRDADGHRTWYGTWRVKVEMNSDGSMLEGPAAAMQCPGLPFDGAQWIIRNDVDVYAWCRSDMTVNPVGEVKEGHPAQYYDVQRTFSTRPPGLGGNSSPDRAGRGQPEGAYPQKQDPLLEQDKLSGSFVRYTEEATLDRFGLPIFTTSFEPIRGPQVEFDRNRPQVRIEQNVLDLQLPMLTQMADTVNDRAMWGFPARCIKLSIPTWSMNYHGNGLRYYTRVLEFDINVREQLDGTFVSGFDRDIYDEGSKALSGKWNPTTGAWDSVNISTSPVVTPDPGNPSHYTRYKDKFGETTRCFFDNTGSGKPLIEKMAAVITNIAGSPLQITSTSAHDLVSGDIIVIQDLAGADADSVNNKQWTVAKVDSLVFTLPTALNYTVSVPAAPAKQPRWYKLTSKVNVLHFEKYNESNFLLLGLRTDGL